MLFVDLVEQIRSDLHGEVVFLGERAKRAGHSAATAVENRGFSARQALRESSHKHGIHERLGVTMRVDCDRGGTAFELKRVRFLRE